MANISNSSASILDRAICSFVPLLLTAGLAMALASSAVLAKGFKVTNVHFETNATACDMGAQIGFDTEGLTEGTVTDPNGNVIYSLKSSAGMAATGGQTEGFLEGVEPQITELMDALGCPPSKEEGTSSLANLLAAWPEGLYRFSGLHKGAEINGEERLSYRIPAGAQMVAPLNGTVLPVTSVSLKWKPVTGPILPYLGPVTIVGYHAIVYEAGAEVVPQLDVDLSADQTSVKIPVQFLKPSTTYLFEVLSTEKSGNQTITEGFFCTEGVADCKPPARRKH